MNIFALSSLLTGISSLVLGFFILFKSKESKTIKIWAIFCFSVVIWGFGGYMVAIANSAAAGLFWWRVTYLGINFIPVLFYHFVYLFLDIKKRTIFYLFYFYGFFFSIIMWTPWAGLFYGPDNISYLFNSLYWVYPPTALFVFYVSFWYFSVAFSHYLLLKFYRNSFGLKRAQIKYFFIGMFIAFVGGGTCFLPCFGVDFYPYLNFAVLLYPAIITYAIIKHRLMDIKMVMRRYSVYLFSLSVILILATAVKYFFDRYFYDYSIWADPVILLTSLFIFPSIKNYFYRLANKYFFSSLYDSREVIANLSDRLRSTLDINRIFSHITEVLTGAFHIKALGLLIYDEKNNTYILQFNNGFEVSGQNVFTSDNKLHQMFIKKNKALVVEELKHSAELPGISKNRTIKLLIKLGVEVLAPLNVKDKTIGLIALGKKEAGDMYNDEDLQVLEVVGAQVAIALENALLYQETKNFNIKLEKEVEKATRDLRRANEQLKKLDAAKSEFISIASHQLRTPLTVIKGYISMMLEGNFGQLTDSEKESLNKVFESNERLIQLVENLLNISRIESGRLQFNFEQVDFMKLVSSVVEELSVPAKKKNLRFEYKQPAQSLPTVKIDPEKIRQVIMNLIDNAIKYTKQGGVIVKVEQIKKNIRFCVSDTGMGISQTDLPNLFKKFTRGTGTSLVHTEGTGLGLYVARIMIESHQGKIWAESAGEGKGSKFCFELPTK